MNIAVFQEVYNWFTIMYCKNKKSYGTLYVRWLNCLQPYNDKHVNLEVKVRQNMLLS